MVLKFSHETGFNRLVSKNIATLQVDIAYYMNI